MLTLIQQRYGQGIIPPLKGRTMYVITALSLLKLGRMSYDLTAVKGLNIKKFLNNSVQLRFSVGYIFNLLKSQYCMWRIKPKIHNRP